MEAALLEPIVSIVLAVFNGMPYLPETLQSLLGQTVTNWELIVLDNGSKDGTLSYLESQAATDSRIHLLHSDTNLGAAAGLNVCIERARAEWLAVIDADDRALPERLERQLAFVEANPDLVATSSLAYYINGAGQRSAKTHHDLTTREAYARYMATNQSIGLLHPGALLRKADFQAIGGYRPEYEPAQDIDMWNRMSERGVVLVQPELLMEYRVHARSVVARRFNTAHLKHLWVEASMKARRLSRPEPSWSEFQAQLRGEPLAQRFNRWREMTGRRLYREAACARINGRPAAAAAKFSLAMSLRLAYSLGRLRSQLLPRTASPA